MHFSHRTLFAVLVFGLIVALYLPERAEAGVTVQDRELVSKRRAGRGVYDYSYRLTIDNVGTTLNGVRVYVSCEADGTELVDDIVEFGDIAENAQVTSTDTFTLRQNRRIPFDPDCLLYEVGFATTVVLSGTVTDAPLSDAVVTGIVIRPDSGRPIIDSGRPIIETFSTVTDTEGNYTLEVEAVTEDDFITLEAQGTGDQENALLTSTVGSVGSLQEVGTSGSIIVDSGDAGSLTVTHITTAQDELVRRLNGGVLPTTDAELAALRSQVNGAELLTLASVIKTVIDNPGVVDLPAGINNTLELIQNEQVFDEFLVELISDPLLNDLLVTATQETAEQLNIGFSPDEIPGRLYAALRDDSPLTGGAYVFDFGDNGDGSFSFYRGTSDIIWTLNADGEVEVSPTDPVFLFESFPTCSYPGKIGTQCRALTYLDAVRIIRLTNGLVYDQVFVLSTTRTTYPDDPLPDEIVEDIPAPSLVFLTFNEDGILPVTPADVAGDEIAAYYFHQDNNSIGVNDPRQGADFLTFNPDGTGSTARRGFGFTWLIGADGSLTVNFDNGDRTQYVVFSEDGDVAQVIGIGTPASSGDSLTFYTEAISYDGVSDFSRPNLANQRYRSLFAIVRPEDGLAVFDYLFLPDGSGCRIVGVDENSTSSERLIWDSTVLNRMDSQRLSSSDPVYVRDRRGWQAIDEEPGELGPRFWVIENADFNLTFDNTYVFTDPTVTPGRINAYELIDDVAGQFDPCGFGTSNSLTTLFASNNGGVGNMFDIDVNALSSVQVTGLDVNLAYAPGTQVEVSVYTVAGGYEGTITAPASCNFDCAFDASAWTLLSTQTVTAAGADQPTFVDVDDIVLDPNTTTGFWVTLARDGSVSDELLYTNIAGPGSADDANISILVGVGVTGQIGTEGVARNRAWNGTVYYDTQ